MTDFFGKKGCHVFSNFELFQFVTDKYLLSASGVPPAGEGVPALLVKAQECLDASTARREEEDLACEAEAAARATSDAGTTGNGDTSTNAAAGAAAARSEEARIEEAVFLQSYIPSSLNEISNPMQEMARLQTGQREPVYASAVRGMLADSAVGGAAGGGVGKDGEKDRERKPAHVLLRPAAEVSTAAAAAKVPAREGAVAGEDGSTESEEDGAGEEGSDDSVDSDCSDDSDDDDEEDDEEEDGAEGAPRERKKKSGKYRRQLPGHADPAERQAEKEARKEARKKAKEEAAKKRTEKIPKHVKKRAMKAGKKKK